MIPKIIHYCWVGPNSMPDIVKHCIDSWHKYMPEYEIRKWDETNIPIQQHNFMKEAYELKKWAFVSDQARYLIIQKYGGIFLDTDLELLKSIDDIMAQSDTVLALSKHVKKNIYFASPGLILAASKGNKVIDDITDIYEGSHFKNEDGNPNLSLSSPRILTKYLIDNYGLKMKDKLQHLSDGILVLPTDYFDPINPRKIFGNKLQITQNTRGIHHGTATWIPMKKRIGLYASILSRDILGDDFVDRIRGKEKMD